MEGSFSFFKTIDKYLEQGGLPGVFSVRSPGVVSQRFETQLETILMRDLQLIYPTTLTYVALRSFLQYLSIHQGQPLEYADVSRETRISVPTLKKLLNAYGSLFLIRSIPVLGDYVKPVYYLEDQGEASHLIGNRRDQIFDLERFLYANLRTQLHYRPELKVETFRFETHAGSYIPFGYRFKEGIVGVLPILESRPTPKDQGSARSFLNKFPKSRVVFATPFKQLEEISSREWIVPIRLLVK